MVVFVSISDSDLGEGADEARARRAIDLSLEKYCSVVATLAPDVSITYDVALA